MKGTKIGLFVPFEPIRAPHLHVASESRSRLMYSEKHRNTTIVKSKTNCLDSKLNPEYIPLALSRKLPRRKGAPKTPCPLQPKNKAVVTWPNRCGCRDLLRIR